MAKTTAVADWITAELAQIDRDVDDLAEQAEAAEQYTDAARATLELDWDRSLWHLELLDRARHAGQMTPAQEARYLALREKLEGARPLLVRLGLAPPPASA